MKNFLMIVTAAMLTTVNTGCSPAASSHLPDDADETVQPSDPTDPEAPPLTHNCMNITIGNITFTATLADNDTANAFKDMLPITVNMNEHGGNEKFYDLPHNLPVASSKPDTIHTGDIMLYGSRTLVLFYKTFRTTYSYTRIGTVNVPEGLAEAVGAGSTTVTFTKE